MARLLESMRYSSANAAPGIPGEELLPLSDAPAAPAVPVTGTHAEAAALNDGHCSPHITTPQTGQ